MSAPPVLKKPKLEIEEYEAEAAAQPEPNGEIVEIADADGGMDEDSLKEQEEALVALFDHRSKEVEHLRKRLSYYKSELDKAERRVQEIQCKLARLRGRRNAKLSKKSSKDSTEDIKVGRHSASPVQNYHDSAERQPQNIAKIGTKSFENCGGNGIKDVKLERRSTSPFKIIEGPSRSQSQSRPQLVIPSVNPKISQPMRKESGALVSNVSGPRPNASMSPHVNSRDKCQKLSSEQKPAETQSKRTRRKMEQNEHKELIPLIRTSSSPCTKLCETGCLISSQHKRKLRSLVLCPTNEQLFVTSALDGVVNLWQVQSKGSRACLLSTTDCASVKQRRWPEDIAWHPDGDSLFLIYTADEGDSQVSILDLNKTKGGNRVKFLEDRPHVRGIINNIMFLPWDDSCFVTGGSDHAVVLWTAMDGENLWKPKSLHRTMHSSAVMGVAGMQQKHIVLSVGADKRIIGFDVLAGRADYTHQIESKCMSVLTNPCDFNLLMVQTGTPERQLRLFDIRLRRTEIHAFGWKQESSESQSALINQSWSPDGLYITSGSADPVIHLFDIRYNAQKPSQSISAHQKRVFKAVWHQNMPLLISISSDLNIGLHNIK